VGVVYRHANAEEREARLEQDEVPDHERGDDDDRRRRVGEDVPRDDATVVRADHARRLDEEHLSQREDLRAHHPREREPGGDGKDRDEVHGARLQDRGHGHGEDERRYRLLDVGGAHDDAVPPVPEITGDEAEGDSDATR
jgi:hypothetical protein